ncbi:insulin-like growth factor-binding protein complex acid labile subunit [Toxorhynchites rutilus septentrionalis]|uniref:insulin-like growth factor-binding protein complex acid labile subunit n=1 Tax=Toxorhynchites rutilus septentrionalis TaxID=329112 RepID=UPI00247A7A44|nr:insulin-like growth factor-binding protein complex acid labile subunit [Toxorhynchites rutilus septentrionalis]
MNQVVVSVLLALLAPQVLAVSFCPNRCVCDDVKLHVTCSEGELDVLPIALNPAIQRLVIKFNRIKAIDSSIQFYTDLTMLDLSYNHMLGVPERIFMYQKQLLQLHLNNNKIGAVSNKTFHGLTELRVLNLRGNFINELTVEMFKSLPALEELNLGQNRIEKLHPNAFEGLSSLRILHLDDNAINVIPTPSFRPLNLLAELFLGTNTLSQIQPGAFEGLQQLRRLDVRGSMLINVTIDTFRGLEHIRSLDISDNHLLAVPTIQLSGLKRLEELKIGQNDFEIIPEGAFYGLSNLRKIDISGALNLKRIQAGAFSANTNLDSITIASNKILTDIEEGAFAGLPHIENVILRDNAIRSVREELLPWKQLRNFDLSENPLVCNCHLQWLRNMLRQKPVEAEQNHVTCEYPERLNGEALRDISPELLGCHQNQSKERAVFGAVLVASAASLTTFVLVVYRLRHRLVDMLGPNWHNHRNTLREEKDPEFGKCFDEIEYCQPSLNIYSYQYHHSYPQRPVPCPPQSVQDHIYEMPIPVSDL